LAVVVVGVLMLKRLAFSGPGPQAWPTAGLLLLMAATAVVCTSVRFGASWYGGRVMFVLFGTLAAVELALDVAVRLSQSNGLSVAGVRLLAAAVLAFVAYEEGQMLYRSWSLFRRTDEPPA
jgi:hypothetical protein